MPTRKKPFVASLFIIVLFGALSGATSCQSDGPGDGMSSQDGMTLPDGGEPPCACTTGAKRCQGERIQVCESVSASCSSWGSAVACPGGPCQNGACPVSCTDTCPGGTTRCANDMTQEVCRIGPSGCLEWTQSSCPSARYCSAGQCVASVPCEPSCLAGYACRPSGVCAGGSPVGLVLDVKTVQVSGSVTLNGAAPTNAAFCSGTSNPETAKARVLLTETTKGYTFVAAMKCKDASFNFSAPIYPGTYKVEVQGYRVDATTTWSSLPDVPYLADSALVLTANTTGKIFDVKTVQVSGSVTLNGAAPTNASFCSSTSNPETAKARVILTEATKGYTFIAAMKCKDASFNFSAPVYPGTYKVEVQGYRVDATTTWSSLPDVPYLADSALVLTADTIGKIFDVKTVQVSGSVTLNGAAPTNASFCSSTSNPETAKARVLLTETTKGYTFVAAMKCKDASFNFSTPIYPGTYKVEVQGYRVDASTTWSSLPDVPYLADSALVLTANTAGKIFDVKTVQVSGSVTLNGAAPTNASFCSSTSNPETAKARVVLTETTRGYTFVAAMKCKDASFNFSTPVYPGIYKVEVQGYRVDASTTWSSLPDVPYLADSALVLTANTAGKIFDVKTVQVSGSATLNGAAPTNAAFCSSTSNPETAKARVLLTETAKGYTFVAAMKCKDASFNFSAPIYPGTYKVEVQGYRVDASTTWSSLPDVPYLADSALVLAADTTGKIFDVKTVQVSGSVTLNGAAPTNAPFCSSTSNPETAKARILLTEAAKGYTFVAAMKCKDTAFNFSAPVYPGTYKVEVQGYRVDASTTWSSLPDVPYLTVRQMQIP